MTDYVCIKNVSGYKSTRKCLIFRGNKIENGDPYQIMLRKCALKSGTFRVTTTNDYNLKLCKDAPSVLSENNIQILLDRDIIDAIRHDSVNRMVNLLTQSNRIKDLSMSIDYNYEGNTLLHEAIYWNSNKCILYLMKMCNNVLNVQNKDGNTVLHIACLKGHSFLINEFYKLGSNISMKNEKGETILHCAVKCGKLDVVKQVFDMMNAPVGLECKDINKRNALHTAVLCRNKNIDIIKFLVNEGSDIINEDSQDHTIITNLNRLEKSSINIQIKTFIKKSAYDIYIGRSKYKEGLKKYPEYAPYVIDGDEGVDDTIVVTYDKNPPNRIPQKREVTNQKTKGKVAVLQNQKRPAKKILPIKFKPMFEYFEDIEPVNSTPRKLNTEQTDLYKEILVICLLFIIAFIFYYE
jgi:ankyrin repeat protein